MISHRLLTLLAVLTLAIAALTPVTAGAKEPDRADRFEQIDSGSFDPVIIPNAMDPDQLVTVMVELTGDPVAVVRADAGRELSQPQRSAIRKQLQSDQAKVITKIESLGGTIMSQMQDAYNGMRVSISASKLADVAATEGVAGTRRIYEYRPTNANSVPYVLTQQVWDDLGLTGQNVKIAIIDTGIDYYHADFGGSGDPADFENDDPTIIEPGTFPTAKVVGGYDFVGDDYDASSDDPALNIPKPDEDPIGCHFHGSHVAGTAAGQGVLLDGTTYTGPYDSTTYTDNEFLVGPGVAPDAELYALKVFGCEGSTDVVTEAIDWAVANDVDVINMSLGSTFGSATDPSAVASNNAAAAGVIVVASAGNSGPGLYLTGSPATADGAISVAALDTIESNPRAQFTYDPGTGTVDIEMQNSNGAPLPEGPLETYVLKDLGDDENLGCRESDFTNQPPTDGWADKVVVTDRAACARIDRAINGQSVGAAAVVMINATGPGLPPFEGPIAGVTIPFLGAPGSDSAAIKAADGLATTLIDLPSAPNPGFEGFATFSSGGPRIGDSGAKPDVTAPGVSIVSAFIGTGSGGVTSSGTSMAAPHVAGLAALVRQARPDWSVEDIKAAIVNTANPDVITNYSTRIGGSGLINPMGAVTTTVVAVGDPATASLSFGYEEAQSVWQETKRVEIRNYGPSGVVYTPSVEWDTDAGGSATVTFSGSANVRPGKAKKINVSLTIDVTTVPSGFQSASGNILLSGSDGSELRVPFMAVPKGQSGIQTTPPRQQASPSDTTVNFRSTNVAATPGDVDVYAWGLEDPRGDSLNNDVRAVGVQSFPDAFGGLGLGVFAINTYDPTSNAAVTEWEIVIDSGNDGTADYVLIGFDLGALTTGSFSGQLAAFILDLSTGSLTPWFFAGGGINSSTVLLPVVWDFVGVSPANPEFSYSVAAYSLEDGGDADIVDGLGVFDAFDESVETGFYAPLAKSDKVDWSASVDINAVRDQGVMGWMLVSQDNRGGGDQAQLVPLRK